MKLYSAIDLHSNNHVLTVIDEQDRRVYERRLANDLAGTLRELGPYREQLVLCDLGESYFFSDNDSRNLRASR